MDLPSLLFTGFYLALLLVFGLLFVKLVYFIGLEITAGLRAFFAFILGGCSAYWKRKWISAHGLDSEIVYKNVDEYSSTLGWALIPNLKNKPNMGAAVSSNSDGVRGKREFEAGKDTVLFLGDSFCFGEGVNDNETVPHFFEECIRSIQSVNLGVHGYGLGQQYHYLKEATAKYKPKLTCFIICYDDFRRVFLDFRDYAKPVFALRTSKAVLTNSPVPKPEYYLSESKPGFIKLAICFATELVRYYGLVDRKKREQTCSFLLDEIKKSADKAGSELVFVYVPNTRHWLLKNYIDSFFIRFFQSRGIKFLDLDKGFGRQELEQMTSRITRHFTAKGNKAIANKLAVLVNESKLL